jgi:hypothetical protein
MWKKAILAEKHENDFSETSLKRNYLWWYKSQYNYFSGTDLRRKWIWFNKNCNFILQLPVCM